jgi:hypothetical protein
METVMPPIRTIRFWSIPLVAVLLAIACEPDPRGTRAVPPPTSDEAVPEAMRETMSCVNPVHRYTVEYPAGWQANTNGIVSPCSLFDPESVAVPPASELPLEIAIQIALEPVRVSTIARDIIGQRVVASEATVVAGRPAIRMNARTTGEGLHDRGINFYRYLIDLGDTTLVSTTYEVGALSFERKRRILDAMMSAFAFLDRR